MLLLAASTALPQFPRAPLQPVDAEPGGLAISALLAPLWERTSLADQRRAGLLGGRNHDTTWAAGDAVTSVAAVAAGAAVPSKSGRPHDTPPPTDAAPEGGRHLSLKVPPGSGGGATLQVVAPWTATGTLDVTVPRGLAPGDEFVVSLGKDGSTQSAPPPTPTAATTTPARNATASGGGASATNRTTAPPPTKRAAAPALMRVAVPPGSGGGATVSVPSPVPDAPPISVVVPDGLNAGDYFLVRLSPDGRAVRDAGRVKVCAGASCGDNGLLLLGFGSPPTEGAPAAATRPQADLAPFAAAATDGAAAAAAPDGVAAAGPYDSRDPPRKACVQCADPPPAPPLRRLFAWFMESVVRRTPPQPIQPHARLRL